MRVGILGIIYSSSDWHLGNEEANYPKIHSFLKLAREKADRIVLCGDILDLWVNYYSAITSQEPMKSCYDDLIQTSKEIPVVYIRGNHDYNVKIPGLNIVDNYLQDGIYFTHGHQFDGVQFLGYPFYNSIAEYFPSIYQRFFRTPFETISENNLYTEQVRVIEEVATRFMEKKGYKGLVFGHTHFPKIKGGFVNCGDFVDSCSYAVIEEGIPSLKRI